MDAAFINKDGFVTVDRNAPPIPGDGNGWLQTGLAYAVGLYTDTSKVPEMFQRCRKDAVTPLIWRSPYKVNPGDENQCDDYWGAALLSQAWAEEMLDWADANGWNFDPTGQKRISFWFGRFVDFKPFLKLAAGRKLSWLQQLILAGGFLWSITTLNQGDANIKGYCRFSKAKNVPGIVGWASNLWDKKLLKKFGTHGASWVSYFGPNHEISKVL